MAEDQLRRLEDLLTDMSKRTPRLEEAFREALSIFSELVQELAIAGEERRKELLVEVQEMSALLGREIPALCQAAGASEPEVISYMKSSQQFSEEHWRLLQSTQEALNGLVSVASKALKDSVLEEPPAKAPDSSHPSGHPHKHKGPKKSDWMKG
ncbi:MAG: hypothetical protein HYX48_03480 [Chlamydiales bacterium]|nr:hypothetical protein [Chlamydiales bacterium]